MEKYLYVFTVSLQQTLEHRASLLMDRLRSLALVLSLYFLWSALLKGEQSLLGYSRSQMLSYVLGMSLLRAFVISGKGWEMIGEIASGKISHYLIRPIHYFGYLFAREMAQKLIYLLSAVLEVAVLIFLFQAPLYLPRQAEHIFLALLAALGASLLYFFLAVLVGSSAFWTSESYGPLFCFELILQFAAGAFFPLDVLPPSWQGLLNALPFPYLVFFPLNVFLERLSPTALWQGFLLQWIWIAALYVACSWTWNKGLQSFAAEGG